MDRAVLDAYDWSDIPGQSDVRMIVAAEQDDQAGSSEWRYVLPDSVCEEILSRLFALNAERADIERLQLGERTASAPSARARLAEAPLLFEEA
jgi:hypothetical protein